jgi:hypothetical protein
MPQLADVLIRLEPRVKELCARANEGERLLSLDGSAARRAPGLDPADWDSLHALVRRQRTPGERRVRGTAARH